MIGKILSELAGRGRRVPREGLLRLSSKNGNQNFYKGKGVKSTGVHTSIGGYKALDARKPEYIIPDLSKTQLKPYVANK